jgi:hypothetical protein
MRKARQAECAEQQHGSGGVADAFEDNAGNYDNVIDISTLRLDAQNSGEGAVVTVWIK